MGNNVSITYVDGKATSVTIKGKDYMIHSVDELLNLYEQTQQVYFIYIIKRRSDNRFYIGKCAATKYNRRRIINYYGSSTILKKTFEKLKTQSIKENVPPTEIYDRYFERYIIAILPNENELSNTEKEMVTRDVWYENEYCLNLTYGGNCDIWKSDDADVLNVMRREILSKKGKLKYRDNPSTIQPLFDGASRYWKMKCNSGKRSKFAKDVWQREGYREMMSENRKKRLSTPEARHQLSINAKKGWVNKSDEQFKRDLDRLQHLWDSDERHERHSRIISGKFKDDDWHGKWDESFYKSIQTDEWRRKNEEHMKDLHERQKAKEYEKRENIAIDMYDIGWNLLRHFDTMNEALSYLKETFPDRTEKRIIENLKRYLKGKLKSAFGFRWKAYDKRMVDVKHDAEGKSVDCGKSVESAGNADGNA